MNLQQIRAKYNKLLTEAELGTFERGAYYNIYTCMTSRKDKQQALSALRNLLKHIDPNRQELYLLAVRDLETRGKGE